MDALHQLISGVFSLICACALGYLVLNQRIHEGFIIKTGLITMVVSLLASGMLAVYGTHDLTGLWNAALVMRIGLLIAIAGVILRFNQHLKGKP